MSWLNELFGKSDKANSSNDMSQPVKPIIPDMEHFKRIFVEEAQPTHKASRETATHEEAASAPRMDLAGYLHTDHRSRGFSDGYNFHSVEKMDGKLRQMRAEFCYLISIEIDQLQSIQATLEVEKIKADSKYTQELYKTLGVRIEQVQSNIEHLRMQLDLSAMEDGLFMHPVESYRDGYLKGMTDFHEIETIINVNGIFNR